MIKEVDREIITKNVELYGEHRPANYLMEEMSELTKELLKSFRGNHNTQEIIAEMGDVYYTLSMLKQHRGITDEEINGWIKFKEEKARQAMGMLRGD